MKIYQNPGFLQRGIDFSPPEALRNVCTAFFTFLAILRNDETRDKLNYLANLGKEACAKFRVFLPAQLSGAKNAIACPSREDN